ncbi:MAG: hypothetical protein ACI81R_000639 [Bradymonadia bacterium]|jgi:hypothetical protein
MGTRSRHQWRNLRRWIGGSSGRRPRGKTRARPQRATTRRGGPNTACMCRSRTAPAATQSQSVPLAMRDRAFRARFMGRATRCCTRRRPAETLPRVQAATACLSSVETVTRLRLSMSTQRSSRPEWMPTHRAGAFLVTRPIMGTLRVGILSAASPVTTTKAARRATPTSHHMVATFGPAAPICSGNRPTCALSATLPTHLAAACLDLSALRHLSHSASQGQRFASSVCVAALPLSLPT